MLSFLIFKFVCHYNFKFDLFKGNFNTESHVACLYEQNVYTLEPGKIQVRNFQVSVPRVLVGVTSR